MKEFIFTCEHAGNNIPSKYKSAFKNYEKVLNTHRGYDLGVYNLFKKFKDEFGYPSFHSLNSRLLIELNRSPNSRNLFSFITKKLENTTKAEIKQEYYDTYRNKVEQVVKEMIDSGKQVYHISFHSFTPEINNKVRLADIGLLYDPKSKREKEFCVSWKKEIMKINHNLKVRFNYPYPGIADGFTSYLRKKYGYENYAGIELEVNQKLLVDRTSLKKLSPVVINSFEYIRE